MNTLVQVGRHEVGAAGGARRADRWRTVRTATAGLLIALPLLTIGEGPSIRYLGFAFAVLILTQVYPLLRRDGADTFSPVVHTGLAAGFQTVATVASIGKAGELRFRMLPGLGLEEGNSLALTIVLASALGQASYLIGYYHPRWGTTWQRMFPSVAGRTWDSRRLAVVSVFTTLVFAVVYYAFQSRLGLSLFEPALALGKEVWRNDPTLTWMLRGLQLGFVPVFLYTAVALGQPRFARLLVPACLALSVGWLVLRSGQRGSAMAPLLAGLIVVHYLWRRIPVMVFIGMLLFATFASNVSYTLRQGDQTEFSDAVQRNPAAPLESLAVHEEERERLGVLGIIFYEFPKNYDHLLGESYLALIALPVPRWLWPEKHLSFEWRDNQIASKVSGVANPTPFLGALYANFSYFGIVFGMLLYGIFHRGLYNWAMRDSRDKNVILLYAMILIFFSPTMLGMSAAIQFVLPVLTIIYVVGRRPVAAPLHQLAPRPLLASAPPTGSH